MDDDDAIIIPVYLNLKQLLIWCCVIQDTCQTFDDDDDYKEPLLEIRNKLLEEAGLSYNTFFHVFDKLWTRLGKP